MAKVLEDRDNNLYFYIYSNDHSPAHVHVFKGKKNDSNIMEAKINIGKLGEKPKLVEANPKMRNKDIVAALNKVAINQEMLLIEWQKIHGK